MKARHSWSLPCECGVSSPDELGVLGGDVQRSKLEPEPKKLWLGFPSQTQGIETWRGVQQISQAPWSYRCKSETLTKLITPPTASRRGPVVQRSAKPIWRGRCMLHRPRWRLPPIALQELKHFHCCKVATVIVSYSSPSSTTPHRPFCPSSIKYSYARCRGALKEDSQC